MLYKNILWACLLVVVPAGFVLPRHTGRISGIKRWVISENSSLLVNGSTNVNKFSCGILAYGQTDTLVVSKTDRGVVLTGSIGLSVESFDCHNSMMTRDLRKTLKEREFPKLRINFLSLSRLPELTTQPQFIKGLVNIEIAGIRKRYEVDYQITIDAQKVIHLLGTREVNFSDFNLIPPRKLGGMIKTNDKLSVEFHLNMTALD